MPFAIQIEGVMDCFRVSHCIMHMGLMDEDEINYYVLYCKKLQVRVKIKSSSSYRYLYESESFMIEQTAWVHAMAELAVGQAVTEISNLNSQKTSRCSLRDTMLFIEKSFLLKVFVLTGQDSTNRNVTDYIKARRLKARLFAGCL
jgi:hypothetical protein